jgi:hypothetical protein
LLGGGERDEQDMLRLTWLGYNLLVAEFLFSSRERMTLRVGAIF